VRALNYEHYTCPVPNCPTLLPYNKPTLIQNHLMEDHSTSEICCVSTSIYSQAEALKCPLYPPQKLELCKSNHTLTNNLTSTHKTASRTELNTYLILSKISPDTIHTISILNNWKNTLDYLHKTILRPFSFRRSLYTTTPIKLRIQLQPLNRIILILIESHSPHAQSTSSELPASQTTLAAIWKLFLIFEGTMLAPAALSKPKKRSILIKHRIETFMIGIFMLLHAMLKKSSPRNDTPTI